MVGCYSADVKWAKYILLCEQNVEDGYRCNNFSCLLNTRGGYYFSCEGLSE